MIRLFIVCVLALLCGCSETRGDRVHTQRVPADEARGRALVEELECVRCHSRAQRRSRHNCVVCHNAIERGAERSDYRHVPFEGPDLDERVRAWNRNIVHFRELPSFVGVTRLLRPEWIEGFLMAPHDLRPRLGESMPHLGIEAQAARDIVAYLHTLDSLTAPARPLLTDSTIADYRQEHGTLGRGDVNRGRSAYADLGCKSCHLFTGAVARDVEWPNNDREERALEVAPDLRFTRDRFRREMLVPWLLDPRHLKHDAAMPKIELGYGRARDLAAFIMEAPLGAAPRPPSTPARLPPLTRDVTYDEVFLKVFGSNLRSLSRGSGRRARRWRSWLLGRIRVPRTQAGSVRLREHLRGVCG